MGLEVGGGTEKEEEEKEEMKIPLCESIGHRPLRGRCSKGESALLLKSFLVACTQLSHSVGRSVGWSVSRLVGWLVGWSVSIRLDEKP